MHFTVCLPHCGNDRLFIDLVHGSNLPKRTHHPKLSSSPSCFWLCWLGTPGTLSLQSSQIGKTAPLGICNDDPFCLEGQPRTPVPCLYYYENASKHYSLVVAMPNMPSISVWGPESPTINAIAARHQHRQPSQHL